MEVFALFSGLYHGGLCPVQRCLTLLSLTCSAVLCHGGLCPVQRCLTLLSDLCIGVWHDRPSVPSGAVAAGALQGTDNGGGFRTSDDTGAFKGTDSGGGLRTSDDTAALQGTDSGGGLRTSDDTGALQGTDSGGGLRTSDDSAGGGVLASREDGSLPRRAAPTRLWRLLLPLHHLGRSQS
ncbi:hypothetical protein NDU88_006388 [Pleurodeles waltl]|uniref:Secreted protein n=1 Tax=Pleurodeles waltl TaxID=8319 RepID=A0AAV7MD59_PLEWA|nr:hypothetical protein NDU88_006388 [Pleurodeles waltl]